MAVVAPILLFAGAGAVLTPVLYLLVRFVAVPLSNHVVQVSTLTIIAYGALLAARGALQPVRLQMLDARSAKSFALASTVAAGVNVAATYASVRSLGSAGPLFASAGAVTLLVFGSALILSRATNEDPEPAEVPGHAQQG